MKKWISVFLIISIIVVGAFSLLAFVSHSHNAGLCPVSAINGDYSSCIPLEGSHNDLAAVLYHISEISNLFNIGVVSTALALFLLMILSLVFLFACFRFFVLIQNLFSRSILHRFFIEHKNRVSSASLSFSRWISRLNKCDYLS